MRPKFRYCPFCGYMFLDTGRGNIEDVCCPMCGEETLPCWECIANREFDKSLCQKCEHKTECWNKLTVKKLPSHL